MWEKLFLAAIITLILSVFASGSDQVAPQRHSQQSDQGTLSPLVMLIK
ncbi:hypothetical protein [Laspinema palackyanum]|uniref:Uncharacterized protein n=1 Tax=Laspinema palackyanum D2a TaxID=2953684 RepID=A0ABT2MJU3_9CYAN|nr:hypothetical protein [Laspinema sp. D2c]MCT7960810.1 hypothetical protein [Laspinema sp. D2b]MCT7964742.1 hypothetical protein [Laspinema sp. D2a]